MKVLIGGSVITCLFGTLSGLAATRSLRNLELFKPRMSATDQRVEKISIPPLIPSPSNTEMALTVSRLKPQGLSRAFLNQSFPLNSLGTMTEVGAQLQHWFHKDPETQQQLGYMAATSIAEKNISADLDGGYSLPSVEVLYLKFLAGVSWETQLPLETLSLSLSGVLTEELWQQYATTIPSRWTQWTPSLGVLFQVKQHWSPSWYTLLEMQEFWPLQTSTVETSAQRFAIGVGYSL